MSFESNLKGIFGGKPTKSNKSKSNVNPSNVNNVNNVNNVKEPIKSPKQDISENSKNRTYSDEFNFSNSDFFDYASMQSDSVKEKECKTHITCDDTSVQVYLQDTNDIIDHPKFENYLQLVFKKENITFGLDPDFVDPFIKDFSYFDVITSCKMVDIYGPGWANRVQIGSNTGDFKYYIMKVPDIIEDIRNGNKITKNGMKCLKSYIGEYVIIKEIKIKDDIATCWGFRKSDFFSPLIYV
jgi:hypothetical protein